MVAVLLTSVSVWASEMDQRIEASAKKSYIFKTYLKDDAITMASKEGVVTLTGTVNEASHKTLAAETVASLPGVKSVDNQLVFNGVEPAENTDAWMSMQVKGSLLWNRNVSAVKTQVFVENGVVTLKGEANSQAQKDLTGAYAKDIKGITDVKNEMTIVQSVSETKQTMGEMIDDASITAQVKMAFLSHHSTSAFKTGVATTNGIVTLTGDVPSGAGKDMATIVAKNVNGVLNVVNNMVVVDVITKK